MLKYGLIAGLIYLAYQHKDAIQEKVSSWFSDKVSFKVHKIKNISFDIFQDRISFDLEFSMVNFLPTTFDISALFITVYYASGVDEQGIIQWQKIAERKDSTTTIVIDQGENIDRINVDVPIESSANSLLDALKKKLILSEKLLFKVDTEVIVEGQENIPLTYSTTFEY